MATVSITHKARTAATGQMACDGARDVAGEKADQHAGRTRLGRRLIGGAAAAALVAGAIATPAASQGFAPDLVVNEDRTSVLQTSCDQNAPLAIIRVAIDNLGLARAQDPNVTTVGLRPIASAAVEHAHYTAAVANSANNLDPGEIETVEIEIGAGMLKAGRVGVSTTQRTTRPPRTTRQQRNLPFSTRKSLQEALVSRGYDTNGVDGIFGSGTLRAIRAYQRDSGARRTGILTEAQIEDLIGGGAFTTATGDRKFRIVVIADPANRVAELDEDNNTWISDEIEIDCS